MKKYAHLKRVDHYSNRTKNICHNNEDGLYNFPCLSNKELKLVISRSTDREKEEDELELLPLITSRDVSL